MASEELEVVALESCHCPIPTFSFPHKYTEYHSTPPSPSLTTTRISTATIIQTVRNPITAATISQCPNLKLIAVMAAGTDVVDLEACKARGITVCNIPSAASETVAEHAVGLYFAVRRNTVRVHERTVEGREWAEKRSTIQFFDTGAGAPRTCKNEVMGIIGGGRLGNLLAGLAKALGMKVLIAERKGLPELSTRPDRTPFTTVLTQSTVLVLTCPLNPSTINTISTPELKSMLSSAILINVARGGIVDETALVQALKEGWIAGAATDVFEVEPATKENSVLLRECESLPNLVLSAHVAWFSGTTVENLQRTLKENVEGWVAGRPQNVVV